MPQFRKWKSINKFSDAYAKAQRFEVQKFKYRGKIKLHGTNAGIHFDQGVAYPQKRSDFIDVYNDNAGFANFVSNLIFNAPESEIIIYGEWAGPGVQREDAVTHIPQKSFFVFSIYDVSNDVMIIEPEEIEHIVSLIFGDIAKDSNVYVLPWHTEEFEIDFSKHSICQEFVNAVTKEVDNVIAKQDPYIKKVFGIEGPGEGMVFYGTAGQQFDGTALPLDILLEYVFKAKTEKHAVQKAKNRNHVAPEKPEGIDEFISMFYTERRFEQMLKQIGGKTAREKTGQFIKAVMSDVYKESKQEILLADFEWSDVPRYATPVVKAWWFNQCNELGL